MKRNARRRGFTLVELIVVLVILAILAALLIPSLTGYIDKANKSKIIAEARNVLVAAQTTVTEGYAKGKVQLGESGAVIGGGKAEDIKHFMAEQIMDLAELPKDAEGESKPKWAIYVLANPNDESSNNSAKITSFYYYNGTYSIEYNSEETTISVDGEEVITPAGWSDVIRGEDNKLKTQYGTPLLSSEDFTPEKYHDESVK